MELHNNITTSVHSWEKDDEDFEPSLNFYGTACYADFWSVYGGKKLREKGGKVYTLIDVGKTVKPLTPGQLATVRNVIGWYQERGMPIKLHEGMARIHGAQVDHPVHSIEVRYTTAMPHDYLYFCLCLGRFLCNEFTRYSKSKTLIENADILAHYTDIFYKGVEYSGHMPFTSPGYNLIPMKFDPKERGPAWGEKLGGELLAFFDYILQTKEWAKNGEVLPGGYRALEYSMTANISYEQWHTWWKENNERMKIMPGLPAKVNVQAKAKPEVKVQEEAKNPAMPFAGRIRGENGRFVRQEMPPVQNMPVQAEAVDANAVREKVKAIAREFVQEIQPQAVVAANNVLEVPEDWMNPPELDNVNIAAMGDAVNKHEFPAVQAPVIARFAEEVVGEDAKKRLRRQQMNLGKTIKEKKRII